MESTQTQTNEVITNTPVPTQKEEFIKKIEDSKGSASVEFALNELGKNSFEQAQRVQAKMKTMTAQILPELNSESPLAKIILEANQKTTELSPHSVTEKFAYKYIPIPQVKNWMIRKYISNFKDQNEQVEEIFEALEEGKEKLTFKMIQLENQQNELISTQEMIEEDVALCVELQKYIDGIDLTGLNETDTLKYNVAKNKTDRKIRDLTTIKAAIQQFLTSINQTMQTQSLLNESIESIKTVGPIVLQNAILIHQTINEQKQVANAAAHIQKGLSQAMEQNAILINENSKDVSDMYKNPVIALDSLQKSYDKLEEAVQRTQKAMLTSSKDAREMTSRLNTMQEKFKPVEEALRESVDTTNKIKSLTGEDDKAKALESK